MTDTKTPHSPEPWHIDTTPAGQVCVIATLKIGCRLVCVVGPEEDPSTEPDAQLIASAPAMRAALASCKAAVENGSLPPSARMEIVRDLATPILSRP